MAQRTPVQDIISGEEDEQDTSSVPQPTRGEVLRTQVREKAKQVAKERIKKEIVRKGSQALLRGAVAVLSAISGPLLIILGIILLILLIIFLFMIFLVLGCSESWLVQQTVNTLSSYLGISTICDIINSG